MTDTVLIILAWITLAITYFAAFMSPFMIGKPREPFSATGAVSYLIQAIVITALCGRVLGWW